MTLPEAFRKLIELNELDGDLSHVLKFSDPDGVRSGKSGWSFGLCQFDLSNNGMAALCLQECNFSTAEIAALRDQTCFDMAAANNRLEAHAEVIAKWDTRQLADCITRAHKMAEAGGWSYTDARAILYAADYHNQLYISKGGDFFNFCRAKKTVGDYDILKFRMNQAWGQKRPDDVKRRHANLLKVCQAL